MLRTTPLVTLLLVSVALVAAAADWPVPEGVKSLPATVRTPHSKKGDAIAPCVIRRVPLGDVGFHAKGGALPDTFVKFAPDGRRLAVATFLGRLKVMDVYTGETFWERRVAEGVVKNMDFSPDGQVIFYGEQSMDGLVCAANARTGKTLWKYRLADDLESSPAPDKNDRYWLFQLPGSFRLRALDDGGVLVLGLHSWGDHEKPGAVKRWSRIYRFSRDGTLKWAYPEEGPLPMTLVYMDADPGGRRVAALATEVGSNAPAGPGHETGALYVLDGATGREVGRHVFAPLKPYFHRVWFWHSISVGSGGRRAAIGAYDGRSFLFDLDRVKPTHTFTFGAPVMMGDIPVSAGATYTRLAPDGMAYFQTGQSSVPGGAAGAKVTAPPGPHPSANTINAVNREGKVAWRYRSGRFCQDFWTSADGRWVITCAEQAGEEGQDAGVMLFDTARPGGGSSKLVYYYQVAGKVFPNADISPDGGALAVVEVPYLDPGSNMLTGEYQLHLIR